MPNNQDSQLSIEVTPKHEASMLKNKATHIMLFLFAITTVFLIPVLFYSVNQGGFIPDNPVIFSLSLAAIVCILLQIVVGAAFFMKINTLISATDD